MDRWGSRWGPVVEHRSRQTLDCLNPPQSPVNIIIDNTGCFCFSWCCSEILKFVHSQCFGSQSCSGVWHVFDSCWAQWLQQTKDYERKARDKISRDEELWKEWRGGSSKKLDCHPIFCDIPLQLCNAPDASMTQNVVCVSNTLLASVFSVKITTQTVFLEYTEMVFSPASEMCLEHEAVMSGSACCCSEPEIPCIHSFDEVEPVDFYK